MPTVRFAREDRQVDVASGTTLRDAARAAGVAVFGPVARVANCHGHGRCGQCRVVVTKGWSSLSSPVSAEFAALRPPGERGGWPDRGIRPEDGERLACQARVLGPVEVWTLPGSHPGASPEPIPPAVAGDPRRDGPMAITGGTGLLGRAVLAELGRRGIACRVLVQPGGSLPPGTAAATVDGDLRERGSLRRLVEGARAVLHLAAVMGSRDAALLGAVNVGGTAALAAAAREAGVSRFVVTSSIAARRPADGPYSASKWGQEDVVRHSGLDWVILQPVVMYGEGSQVQAMLARLGSLPAVPVIGGSAPLHPLHPADVAHVCVEAALRPGIGGRTYQLGGPDSVSFSDLCRRLLAAAGLPGRPLPLPVAVAKGLGLAMERVLPRPPLTLEGVRAVVAGTDVDASAAVRDLSFAPRRLEEGIGPAGRHG